MSGSVPLCLELRKRVFAWVNLQQHIATQHFPRAQESALTTCKHVNPLGICLVPKAQSLSLARRSLLRRQPTLSAVVSWYSRSSRMLADSPSMHPATNSTYMFTWVSLLASSCVIVNASCMLWATSTAFVRMINLDPTHAMVHSKCPAQLRSIKPLQLVHITHMDSTTRGTRQCCTYHT